MILEEETFEAFGYFSKDLKPKSKKPIIAACETCGKFRILSKEDYRSFCASCAQKGKHLTEETKVKTSIARKGEKHPMFGKTLTEETKAKIGAAQKGKKNANYKGGMKVAKARNNAKRKRDLGYSLLAPTKEGEVGHHITDVHVIGIPEEVHRRFCGHRRKKHRTLVLQWLKTNDKKKYMQVLCVLAKAPLK